VDLTRHNGRPTERLLDLVPGRSGKAYADWLTGRGEPFTTGIAVATLDPFRGDGNAIRDELEDATAVLDAFHVVKVGATAMEETRRRVQQEQLGHRGRKHDPLYKIRNILRAGAERLTARQLGRLELGLEAGDADYEVTVAWRCYQQGRAQLDADDDMTSPTKTCLSRIDAGQRSQLPQPLQVTINGIIELHRRIARGFRKTPTTTASA